MKSLDVMKSYIRDLKMNLLMYNGYELSLDSKRQSDALQFLRKNNKLIKYTKSLGGVLTGSRALKCYKLNNKYILERETHDWDFLITRDMAFKICDKFKIKYNLVDKFLTINSSFIRWDSAYSGVTRILPQDVQLIIVDELPEYKEVSKTKFADITYILGQKIDIIESLSNKNYPEYREIEKHESDLAEIIVKFNSI